MKPWGLGLCLFQPKMKSHLTGMKTWNFQGLCNVWAVTHWVQSEEYIYPAPCICERLHLTLLVISPRFSRHPIVPGLTQVDKAASIKGCAPTRCHAKPGLCML